MEIFIDIWNGFVAALGWLIQIILAIFGWIIDFIIALFI